MARKKKLADLRPIDIVKDFLAENGVESRRYNLRQTNVWIDFIKINAPMDTLNVHVVGHEICIRMGQLTHGWDITIKGSIADPSNGALNNLLAFVHHFHTDAWVLMEGITDRKRH